MFLETNNIISFLIFATWLSLVRGIDIMRQIALAGHRSPSYLSTQMSSGDIIACRIVSNEAAIIYGAEHTVLAVSSEDVVHVMADADDPTWGRARLDNFMEMATSEGYGLCRKATGEYDHFMMELGFSPKNISFVTSDARKDVGREGYYNQYDCNCEHWITHWRYGAAWSVQSNQRPGAECRLENRFTNGARAGASSYSKNGQHSAMSIALVGEWTSGSGVTNAKAIRPNAGAHAGFGLHNTGAGFKAGLGQISGKVGQFGATLGLNIDTGLGFRAEGVTAKVLGTGVSMKTGTGLSVCIFGTCLHIG